MHTFILPTSHIQTIVYNTGAKEVPPTKHVWGTVPFICSSTIKNDTSHGPL
ncbi:hypothetical protein MtrunA17_Chr4g0063541 [Medicago truncatula]|uniref:Uncharacterized protein n=1 Tax=Medicago truncatula TaxID=3880 RepID=A0A396IEB0_MEDTR|nr:hypothetical protein MtrunA17_Chr4g0063541 [Medicago truncatula]